MTDPQFRIPKVNVPVICHTVQGEKLAGEIFLDVIHAEGYDVNQVLDFLNAQPPFFALKQPSNRTVLIHKDSVVQIDIPQLGTEYREATATFAIRKESLVHLTTLGPVRITIILDLPEEYSRVLDLVNMAKRTFFPAFVEGMLAVLSIRHIYKIEEL